jgi:hypothetical protein
MKFRLLLLFVLLLPLTACTVHSGGYGGYRPPYDPPPYGQWRWDPGLSVYVSLGHADLYFGDRYYYRWRDGGWYWSSRYDGPWRVRDYRYVPPALYKKYPAPRGAPGYGKSPGDRYQGQDRERGQGDPRYQGQGRERGQGDPRYQGQGRERGQGDPRYQGQDRERGQGNSQQQGKGSVKRVPQGQPSNQGGDNRGGQWQQPNQDQDQDQGKGQGQELY